MKKISKLAVGTAIGVGLTSILSATSLQNSVVEMLKTHPTVLNKLSNYRKAKEELNIAKSRFLPKVDVDGNVALERTKNATTNYENKTLTNRGLGIQLSENLFNGFADTNNVKKREAIVMSAAYSFINTSTEYISNIVEVYLDVLKQRDLSYLSKESLSTHKNIFTQLKDKVDSGANTKSDLIQMEGRVALAYSNYVLVRKGYQDALAKYYKLMGRFESEDNFQLVYDDIKLPASFEEAADISLKYHPAMKVQKYNIVARKKDFDVAKSKFYPKVDFLVRQDWKRDVDGREGQNDKLQGGLSFDYNLYNGGADEHDRQKLLSQVHQEFEEKNRVRRELLEGLRLAWIDQYMIQKQLVHLATHKKLSKQTLEAYNEEFQIGRRTLLELLDAENEYKASKEEEIKSKYGYLLQKFRVLEAMGVLGNYFNIDLQTAVDLQRSPIRVKNVKDTHFLDVERDKDRRHDDIDVCDNSKRGAKVSASGCGYVPVESELDFVNVMPKSEPKPVLDEVLKTVSNDVRQMIEAPSIQPLNFIYKKTELVNESKVRLRGVVNELLKIKPYINKLVVTAHTDSIGSKKYNNKLSQRRADSIKKTLTGFGLDSYLIDAKGMGETHPIAPNTTKANRLKNRRVEFQVLLNDNSSMNSNVRSQNLQSAGKLSENTVVPNDALISTNNNELKIDTIFESKPVAKSVPRNAPTTVIDEKSIFSNSDQNEMGYAKQDIVNSSVIPVLKFKTGSYQLTNSSKRKLKNVATEVNKLNDYRVDVYAHTDSGGTKQNNEKLSSKRAEIVKYELVKLGVDQNKILAYGMGEDYPIASNKTKEGKAKNRRVELKIILP